MMNKGISILAGAYGFLCNYEDLKKVRGVKKIVFSWYNSLISELILSFSQ